MKQFLNGKYSKCIVILQESDLEFEKSKSKKSLVFVELMCEIPYTESKTVVEDHLPDESMFLINTLDPWYGDINIYIFKSKPFGMKFHDLIEVEFDTSLNNKILLATLFTIVVSILSFDVF